MSVLCISRACRLVMSGLSNGSLVKDVLTSDSDFGQVLWPFATIEHFVQVEDLALDVVRSVLVGQLGAVKRSEPVERR